MITDYSEQGCKARFSEQLQALLRRNFSSVTANRTECHCLFSCRAANPKKKHVSSSPSGSFFLFFLASVRNMFINLHSCSSWIGRGPGCRDYSGTGKNGPKSSKIARTPGQPIAGMPRVPRAGPRKPKNTKISKLLGRMGPRMTRLLRSWVGWASEYSACRDLGLHEP